jgi:aminopeptidase
MMSPDGTSVSDAMPSSDRQIRYFHEEITAMHDPRIEKLAEVLVNYSVAVKSGDKVLLRGETVAEPLYKALYAKVLEAGGNPLIVPTFPGVDELRYRLASDEQLQHVPEPIKVAMETYDCMISIMCLSNTKAMSNVDPEKMALTSQAQRELFVTTLRRMGEGDLRWVGTLFPTNAHAQDAEMGLIEYQDFVYGACLPDMEDPVGYWQSFSKWQQKIVDWLKGKQEIQVQCEGTDLRLSIADRPFINCDGRENMPDGEVFTSPVEDSVEGYVTFSYPAVYRGREVVGVQLWFEKGKVVKATAEKNEEFLLSMLDTDEGARYVGEFAIGTNKGITRFVKETLFDEKIHGTFHMAVGAALPETGSKNESAIHWDMVCDLRKGGEIRVDGEVFHRDGDFVVTF